MILSDKTILNEMRWGNIIIDPFEPKHLNPNSVDLRFGRICKINTRGVLDPRQHNPIVELIIPEEVYHLDPVEVYLYGCN